MVERQRVRLTMQDQQMFCDHALNPEAANKLRRKPKTPKKHTEIQIQICLQGIFTALLFSNSDIQFS